MSLPPIIFVQANEYYGHRVYARTEIAEPFLEIYRWKTVAIQRDLSDFVMFEFRGDDEGRASAEDLIEKLEREQKAARWPSPREEPT